MFRKLKASEIDARVSTVSQRGCSILLYKDARVDQKLLDETFGVFGWQRSHQLIGDRLYCTVEVWDDEKLQWIAKQDVGTESYTEKEKGQASDSFKRACFNLGIGRELYTAPFIWIDSTKCKIEEKNGKFTTYDRFEVKDIRYDEEGNISYLEILNAKTRAVVYTFGKYSNDSNKTSRNATDALTAVQLKAVRNALEKRGKSEEGLCQYFKIQKLEDMTQEQLVAFNQMLGGN